MYAPAHVCFGSAAGPVAWPHFWDSFLALGACVNDPSGLWGQEAGCGLPPVLSGQRLLVRACLQPRDVWVMPSASRGVFGAGVRSPGLAEASGVLSAQSSLGEPCLLVRREDPGVGGCSTAGSVHARAHTLDQLCGPCPMPSLLPEPPAGDDCVLQWSGLSPRPFCCFAFWWLRGHAG